jgi:hypothetical protein
MHRPGVAASISLMENTAPSQRFEIVPRFTFSVTHGHNHNDN